MLAGKAYISGRTCHLIKFLLVIRGTLMAAPSKLLPVMKIPLAGRVAHQAAPPTESPTQSPIPRLDQKYGEMFLKRKNK